MGGDIQDWKPALHPIRANACAFYGPKKNQLIFRPTGHYPRSTVFGYKRHAQSPAPQFDRQSLTGGIFKVNFTMSPTQIHHADHHNVALFRDQLGCSMARSSKGPPGQFFSKTPIHRHDEPTAFLSRAFALISILKPNTDENLSLSRIGRRLNLRSLRYFHAAAAENVQRDRLSGSNFSFAESRDLFQNQKWNLRAP